MNSSEFFNSWDIEIKEEYKELYCNFFSSDYIKYFDKNENNLSELFIDTTKQHFSLLEKIIYDIGMFHFKRVNIEFDENKHNIEFWIPVRDNYNNNDDNNISSLHIDCDEEYRIKHNKRTSPFLSTVTYINYDSNRNNPTIITNIEENNSDISNKDKLFQYNKFYFSFPKFLKHISFEGGKYYHGILNYSENTNEKQYKKRQVLAIGLWDKQLVNNNYFTSKYENVEKIYLQTIPKNTCVIEIKKNIMNTKIIVKKEENTNDRFFNLKKNSIFKNIYDFFYFNYKMYIKDKEMQYFTEIIKENNKDELYDNFCIHYI